MIEIKICGLSRDEDIEYVNECRPDYIGFILNYPKSHRNITPGQAKKLKERLAVGIRAVGVFVNSDIGDIVEAVSIGAIDMIQLHGNEDNDYILKLKKELRLAELSVEIIKAIQVKSDSDLIFAKKVLSDMILLDAGMGDGKLFSEEIIEKLKNVKRPFILAGGLNPENVVSLIEKLHPAGVDVSGGVETDGKKDEIKIAKFIKNVQRWK